MTRAPTDDLRLGAHMSVSGGLHKAVERIRAVDGAALQIFTRNQRQWDPPPLTDQEIAAFTRAREDWGPYPVAVHDSYLINLANPDPDKAERSTAAFAGELERCAALAIPLLVTHPGSHLGAGTEAGVRRYAANLDRAMERAMERADAPGVTVLLETTAGQGTNLGSTFEELAAIIEASAHGDRLGVCLDTCHAFAAGHELRTPQGVEQTLAGLDRAVGLDRLGLVHLNDSQGGLGSRLDRHEHIGRGELGAEAFRLLFRALSGRGLLSGLPLVLETPKDGKDRNGLEYDRHNLALLRGLARRRTPVPPGEIPKLPRTKT